MATLDRFRDTGDRLVGLARDDILVACPACGRRAVDAPRPTDVRYVLCWPRRLSCHHCGHSAVWTPRLPSVWGGAVDPFFRTPLWLVAPCKGHTLWAFNVAHLDILEGYVAAGVRERGPRPGAMTMVERLPAWLKSAKNRDHVLRAITRLRAMAR